MNKYTNVVTEINPMGTSPVWDYYDEDTVDTVFLFYNNQDVINTCVLGYYDRATKVWRDHYTNSEITEELLGWLPGHSYVPSSN